MALGDLTQESVLQAYDSDGAIYQPTDMEREGILPDRMESNGSLSSEDSEEEICSTVSNPEGPNDPRLTDAQMLSKFKSVLTCHKSQKSKQQLWKALTKQEVYQKKQLIRQNPGLIGIGPQEFVSLHLPINKANESVQNSYRHSRTATGKRRR